MPDWEFLIQQKGDRQWHSLQNAVLAAETYRMVARSPHPHSPVEVEVSCRELDGDPTPKSILLESRTANEEGLIAVFSYRYLPAGDWAVAIASTNPAITGQGEIAFTVSPPPVIDVPPPAESLSAPTPVFMEGTAELGDSPALAIALEQSALQDVGPDSIPIAGRVTVNRTEGDFHYPARLRYRIIHPVSGEALVDEVKSWLPDLQAALPFSFKETLCLPLKVESDILDGEVSVETAECTLARAPFTLSVNLNGDGDWEADAINYTIRLLNTEERSSFTFDILVPREIAETSLHVDLPNPSAMKGMLRPLPAARRSILPPKIDLAIAKAPAQKSLQLPKLSTPAE
jgi:hypothetical protein